MGDPAIDLAIAHSFLPVHAHQSFIKAYGEISDANLGISKTKGHLQQPLLVLFGYHSNDPSILREGLRSLKVMAIESD